MINIKLDHQQIKVKPNQTILSIAKANGVKIPTLCYLPRSSFRNTPRAVCRMCVVEIKGENGLVSACSTKAVGGMEIFTHSESVLKSRRVLMEFILAENRNLTQDEEAGDENTQVKQLSAEIGISSARFTLPIDTKLQPKRQLSEYISIDLSRCIHCDRCIIVCDVQQVIKRSGFGSNIVNSFGDSDFGIEASNCSYCGDCVAVCPAGGIKKA